MIPILVNPLGALSISLMFLFQKESMSSLFNGGCAHIKHLLLHCEVTNSELSLEFISKFIFISIDPLFEYNDNTFKLGHVTDKYESIFYGRKAQQIALIWGTEFIAGCADCAFQSYCGADPVRNYSANILDSSDAYT